MSLFSSHFNTVKPWKWMVVANKEQKLSQVANKEIQNFQWLIRNLNFFWWLIRNFLLKFRPADS
jgi:hypothetical protein